MKLFTLHLYRQDIEFARQLMLNGVIANVSELIRSAILHYVFFETIGIIDDKNYCHVRTNGPKKTTVPVHFPKLFKELIKAKYGPEEATFNYSLHIRQFVSAYLKKMRENIRIREGANYSD